MCGDHQKDKQLQLNGSRRLQYEIACTKLTQVILRHSLFTQPTILVTAKSNVEIAYALCLQQHLLYCHTNMHTV